MTALKDEFMLDPSVTYLNHGSFGATPKPVFQAYQDWQRLLERQPVEFLGRRFNDLMYSARAVLADYVGTQPENVVYTQNVTIALNIVARSLKLGPGDEVLSTDHEYGALDRTWRFMARENGFTYINQPIALPLVSREQFIESLWAGVTPRTRLIFLSHITSPTAIIFPVEEVIQRARQQGILTVIDGAHAPGQVLLELDKLGADFYGGNLHKWLCAPKGAGFLYARPEAQDLLKPLVVSWGYESETPGDSLFIDHHEWWGTRDPAAFLAVEAAMRFQQKHKWGQVLRECHALAGEALRRISHLSDETQLHNGDDHWFGQMVSAVLPAGTDPEALKSRLYDDHRIEVPVMRWNGRTLVRVSIQAYNSEADVDRLVNALQMLLTG
jgi:isopenicillin-N epimerase